MPNYIMDLRKLVGTRPLLILRQLVCQEKRQLLYLVFLGRQVPGIILAEIYYINNICFVAIWRK